MSTDSEKPVSPVGSADAETPSGVSPNGSPVDQIKAKVIEAQVIEVLRTVYDPEIPVNIYELGLIYGIEVQPDNRVNIRMTLTSPACPVAGSPQGCSLLALPKGTTGSSELVDTGVTPW